VSDTPETVKLCEHLGLRSGAVAVCILLRYDAVSLPRRTIFVPAWQ